MPQYPNAQPDGIELEPRHQKMGLDWKPQVWSLQEKSTSYPLDFLCHGHLILPAAYVFYDRIRDDCVKAFILIFGHVSCISNDTTDVLLWRLLWMDVENGEFIALLIEFTSSPEFRSPSNIKQFDPSLLGLPKSCEKIEQVIRALGSNPCGQ